MIPITIITGFLGSGKTTLILNLLPQLPSTYKLALLKNEYGDIAVDSQLASSRAISGVQELLNGCICCNLVGQLSDALDTLANDIKPDRIVIETSGSAFPATLAMEVNRLARETGRYVLDGVLSVIDVENWKGYEDTSYTAKMQARYTDLIVLNKHELVSERRLEDVEDAILALEVEPQIPRTKSAKGWVDKDIVFGLDARLAGQVEQDREKHEESHDHGHASEIEVLSVTLQSRDGTGSVNTAKLAELLAEPTKDEVYRIKGVLYASSLPASSDKEQDGHREVPDGRARWILNWAFGRWTFTPVALPAESKTSEPELRLTVMTARYESNKWKKQIEGSGLLKLTSDDVGDLVVEKVA
ncbi:cobalamin synthesis protein/P47K:Cobalamin synthesis protein-like protein/P47K [Setomelanomma holmii]|uniref:Cobalamin synthesis protein/P47K:Cobalamin synthesis protein-like protein/P47K n=1 Tax=Setomelanomma holmii TaxID=210430 RepID=A0A9P4HF77_9PLEO|nr:cobalamin synthesis protein/P47K:Cobalamin synthesis protein-like protein/P47K [Setomelanomma holmii]